MVRVWYEPPPFGPGTDLNRSPYGIHGGGLLGRFNERLSKMNPVIAIGVPVVAITFLCWIPMSKLYLCENCVFLGDIEWFLEMNDVAFRRRKRRIFKI